MKSTTKVLAHEIADDMLSAIHGVNIKRKMKLRILKIAKKIAVKVIRNKKKTERNDVKILQNSTLNHRQSKMPPTSNSTKPKGLRT